MSILLSQELLISTALVVLVPLYYLCLRVSCRSKNQSVLPTNWPILHMFPSFMSNLHNLHDYFTLVFAGSGHSFRAHGPPGSGMRFFITCDPANVRHIFTTNYANFPKGTRFADTFDILDGSLFTIDGEPWRRHRTKVKGLLASPRLVASMVACCCRKVENDLLPLFTHMSNTNIPFDMQHMMSRFMFDLAAMPLFGVDPGLLSSEMPPMVVAVALDIVMEVVCFRHMMPSYCWKLMRWLNIGPEKKLNVEHTLLRRFIKEMMERRNIKTWQVNNDEEEEGVDIVSFFLDDPCYANDDLFCAITIGYMLVARDTVGIALTWIFYNLAQNPNIVSIIRNELSPVASHKVVAGVGTMVIFEPDETRSLSYLRAALMEGIWGKDCLDYNPDRWLLKDGDGLRYVPPHKFLAFNSGPRMCLGKEIAVMQMMIVVASTLWNFDVHLEKGQSIEPKASCILEMKNGLMVKLKKREV
ncbi:hypothetical protein VPH35_025227 [Triticum aestivum]